MIDIPPRFWNAIYNGEHYPGSAGANGLEGGANCQQFAYELIRYFGRKIPDFRSSDLWADEIYTQRVETPQPLDLLLFNATGDAFGAHIGVYLGPEGAVHLSKEVGRPAIWTLATIHRNPRYSVLVGIKRVLS